MFIILAPNSTPIVRSWTGWNLLSVGTSQCLSSWLRTPLQLSDHGLAGTSCLWAPLNVYHPGSELHSNCQIMDWLEPLVCGHPSMFIILAPNSTPIVRSWTGWNLLSVGTPQCLSS